MFIEIFLFEIRNRVRRPAFYLYFSAVFIFTVFSFATGSLPLAEKVHINSPYLIAFWCAGITMMMMLISSSLMGTAIFRDIEYQTKDYYLTYPITKAGYFWGRFWGSFAFMVIIAFGILAGIYFGSVIGPLTGKTTAAQYGPNNLSYYLYPFFTIALPNIFFTSSLFFGLVAIMRDVKVIYFGGILLFLFYVIGLFFLDHINNPTIIGIIDPFGLNGVRMLMNNASATEQNTQLILMNGPLALNRIIWPGLGLLVIIFTYVRFNFERFFAGKRDKASIDETGDKSNKTINAPKIRFNGKYERRTLTNLIRIELLNIISDNYFWIIIGCGSIFMGFVFWLGNNNGGVPDFPRTVTLLGIFNDAFPFFIFFIIMFYTGETLQRDRITRYAYINDSLPPPNWVLNGSKLISLLVIGAAMSVLPMLIGITVQLIKGFHQLNFAAYFSYLAFILLPKLLEMVVFCYLVNVVLNNKFAAYGVGVSFWVGVFFLETTGIFDYHLLLYSYTPNAGISDMDGMGHMVAPISWFDAYWLICSGIMVILAGLFYYRGVSSSFKERLQLIPGRFTSKTKLAMAVLLFAFLAIGSYIYYNVSYLNNYLTSGEQADRAVMYEKALKKYEKLPLPKVTGIKLNADIYPDKQAIYVHAFVTVVNKNNKPVRELLLDADELTGYSLKINGKAVAYTCPLMFPRGEFNWFRPKMDSSDFRMYTFDHPLAPGDSMVLEINSLKKDRGFKNGLFAANMLHNGTFFTGGLPGMGYDDDDEISSPYERKKNGLPPKNDEDIQQNDPVGMSTLMAGKAVDLLKLDITVSTAGNQTAIAPGELIGQWKKDDRNYFHYKLKDPGSYSPFGIVSARLAVRRDSVMLGHEVNINIYYHPQHMANINRYISAFKDGLKYYSSVYGDYPSNTIKLVETAPYGPREASMPTMYTNAEYFGWNADFSGTYMQDYCYLNTIRSLAQQWWRFQVAPNSTIGAMVIPEGLATYDELVMAERAYGKTNMRSIVLDQLWYYLFIRRHLNEPEHPVIKANNSQEWGGKAGVVIYGLRNLIGEDSLNKALNEFRAAYAYKANAPFAGSNNLYDYLKKHVPDSLQYYLADTWQKITLYDNKVTMVKAEPATIKGSYKVTFNVMISKVWVDPNGNDIDAKNMNDYIDIGIFGNQKVDKLGLAHENPLFMERCRLTKGLHKFSLIVKEKPKYVGVDPYGILIDRNPNDNLENLQ